jgi:dCTP deaminase
MSICSDKWIIEKCRRERMIEPFTEGQVRVEGEKKVISYGVSSYDIRDHRPCPNFVYSAIFS